jgi:hypothetical protein
MLIEAGGVLITIIAINGLINDESVFPPLYLMIGGTLIASGIILIPLVKHKYTIGFRWKLKVLEAPPPWI